MCPIIVFAKSCWSIHSEVVKLARMRTANREKPLPRKLCSFTSRLCTCPASSTSMQAQCIFSTYGLAWSNIRNSLDAEKEEKLIKKKQFSKLKKVTSRIYSNCSNYSSLFCPSRFVAVRFVSLKNVQLTVQVCCLFYFLLHSKFSQEN